MSLLIYVSGMTLYAARRTVIMIYLTERFEN